MDGAEGAGSFNELYELVVTSPQPLPDKAEQKVRREPDGLRFRMGEGGGRGG